MTVILATHHYFPDESSTSVFLTSIAEELAQDDNVLVISGTAGSATEKGPHVRAIPTWAPPKDALVQRTLAMIWLCIATFGLVTRYANRKTPVFVVTTPFLLPYFVVLGAWLRRAPAALIVYDLYPDVLVATGMTSNSSWLAAGIKQANQWLFRRISAVVIIGRDMKRHVASYCVGTTTTVHYIPHWSTLVAGERPIDPGNPYRIQAKEKFLVGLSGNLGFTHDPDTVFDAARKLAGNPAIHFILSGWGIGWQRIVDAQRSEQLPNVTLAERVSEDELETFLSAADTWIIPYRKNMSGISVPSRLYNLLAIGRPIVALAEADAEHALMISEHNAGWVVEPENSALLAETIALAAANPTDVATKRAQAVQILTERFTRDAAGNAYRSLAKQLRTKNGNGAP